MKKIYWIVPAVAVGAAVVAKRTGLLKSSSGCETSPESADPALRTRVYSASPEAVRDAVKTALASQTTHGRPWHIVAEREDGAVAIRVEVPVFVFTHDLTVTVSPHEQGARLDVHSVSRAGGADFGRNRRHVLQLLEALDSMLQKAETAALPDRRKLPRLAETAGAESDT